MENLKQAINLLDSVVSTMDTIFVVGLDNQDKFVGCASAVQTAKKQIQDFISASSEENKKPEVTDG